MVACLVLGSMHYASAQVRIEATLYDPVVTETGGEFALLRNYGNNSVDISGWTLATASTDRDVVFAQGTIIRGGLRMLIADIGWNTSRDNMSWPLADLEDTITLGNQNSGIALMNGSTIIDAVGWGTPADARFYIGTPSPHVNASGQILLRVANTGNNSADFIVGDPFAQTGPPADRLPIEVTVVAPTLVIFDVLINGIHNASIIPTPGQISRVPVLANLSAGTTNASISFLGLHYIMQQNGSLWYTRIDLPYSAGPGTYDVTVHTSSVSSSIAQAFPLSVEPVLAYALENASISFGSVAAGGGVSPALRPTLRNIGNLPIDMVISSTSLNSPSGNIPASKVMIRDGGNLITLDTSQALAIGLGPTQRYLLDILLEIPAATAADTYRGSLLVRGVRS